MGVVGVAGKGSFDGGVVEAKVKSRFDVAKDVANGGSVLGRRVLRKACEIANGVA